MIVLTRQFSHCTNLVRAPLFGEPLAKTRSSRMGELGGYRHEFGSLRDAMDPTRHRADLDAKLQIRIARDLSVPVG